MTFILMDAAALFKWTFLYQLSVSPLCHSRLTTVITKKKKRLRPEAIALKCLQHHHFFSCCQICQQTKFSKGAFFYTPSRCPCSAGFGQQVVTELFFSKLDCTFNTGSVHFQFFLLFISIGRFQDTVQ